MKVVYFISLFFFSYSNKRPQWNFSFSKKQIAPAAARISTLNDMTIDKCAIKCTKTKYCQSVSYNDKTKQCVLQATLSTDKYLRPVDDADFTFGDLIPGLAGNERMSHCTLLSLCQNNGTCIDGLVAEDYSCNCTDGYNGTNCAICFNTEVFRGQNCTMPGPSILLIGGQADAVGLNTIELYDINEPANSRVLIKVLDVPLLSHVSVLLQDGVVLIASGYKSDSVLSKDTVFFDLRINQFSIGPSLNEERVHASGAMVNNSVYICGGQAAPPDWIVKGSCEKMDLNKSVPLQWVYTTPMNTERYLSQLIEWNGYLYAIGGKSPSNVKLSSMERYDPNTDSWQMKTSMSEARCGSRATVFNGMFFVCGGKTGVDDMSKTCERYKPTIDQWFTVASMIEARWIFGLASVDGKLFAFGNENVGDGSGNKVEWYDPTADSWTITEPLKGKRCYHTAVVII